MRFKFSILLFLFIGMQSCINITRPYSPKITTEYIDFDGCNYVSIYELSCNEGIENPDNCDRFQKVASLFIKDTAVESSNNINRIYFDKEIKYNLIWVCEGYDMLPKVRSETLCYNFNKKTWYEFWFHKQSFTVFVYVDSNGVFENFIKRYP